MRRESFVIRRILRMKVEGYKSTERLKKFG